MARGGGGGESRRFRRACRERRREFSGHPRAQCPGPAGRLAGALHRRHASQRPRRLRSGAGGDALPRGAGPRGGIPVRPRGGRLVFADAARRMQRSALRHDRTPRGRLDSRQNPPRTKGWSAFHRRPGDGPAAPSRRRVRGGNRRRSHRRAGRNLHPRRGSRPGDRRLVRKIRILRQSPGTARRRHRARAVARRRGARHGLHPVRTHRRARAGSGAPHPGHHHDAARGRDVSQPRRRGVSLRQAREQGRTLPCDLRGDRSRTRRAGSGRRRTGVRLPPG